MSTTTKESPATIAGRALVAARWAKRTAEEKAQIMAEMRARRTPETMGAAGRDPEKPRCPCGEMTAKRAAARRHRCEAPRAKTKTKRTEKTAP